MKLPDLDHLPKDRRDWLEVFGNQWGTKKHGERMTEEENAILLEALNPFGQPISAHDRALLRLLDFVDRYHGMARKPPAEKIMPGTCEACVWGKGRHLHATMSDAPICHLDV